MKNVLNTYQLRLKYDPDSVLRAIDINYQDYLEKLREWICQDDNPLFKYRVAKQISFLEKNNGVNTNIINDLLLKLKDPIYFVGLRKKERIYLVQKMRGFYTELLKTYLARINMLMDDPELLNPKQYNTPVSKHRGIETVFEILKIIKNDLESEVEHRKTIPRIGHLTCFQVSMGAFFIKLSSMGVSQKNQITIVQQLFETFNLDWDEIDRENIKLSILKPSLGYFEKTTLEIQNLRNYYYPKLLNDNIISNMINQSIIFKKQIRRF